MGEALNTLLREFADGRAVTIYGDPSAQLAEMAKANKNAKITWFAFLGGPESSPCRMN